MLRIANDNLRSHSDSPCTDNMFCDPKSTCKLRVLVWDDAYNLAVLRLEETEKESCTQ